MNTEASSSKIRNNVGLFAGFFVMRQFGDMSDQSFWNNFYASRQGDKIFDWFVRFEDICEHLQPYLPPVSDKEFTRILDIGCGTSDFSLKLFEHLNQKCRIECIDFSPEAIKALGKIIRERGFLAKKTLDAERRLETNLDPRDWTGLACHQADAKNLPFREETFSLAIDKGTSDAVLKGPNGERAFLEVVGECLRVLKPHGKLVQFSDEPPELRLNALEKVQSELPPAGFTTSKSFKVRFSWRELDIRSGFQHFLYVVHKESSA